MIFISSTTVRGDDEISGKDTPHDKLQNQANPLHDILDNKQLQMINNIQLEF